LAGRSFTRRLLAGEDGGEGDNEERARIIRIPIPAVLLVVISVLGGCSAKSYHTFADYPGFAEYYRDRCPDDDRAAISDEDRQLLHRYRPRLILPPGGRYPIDLYRDYLPYTSLKRFPSKEVLSPNVTRELLRKNRDNRQAYLDLSLDRYREDGLDRKMGQENGPSLQARRPVLYGRIYREAVDFPDGAGGRERRNLTFLKYNALFAVSGLPAKLPWYVNTLLTLTGFSREDWHELDNFVAVHVALDESRLPLAIVLAQHNHHRSYLLGKDLPLPDDGRVSFDIALRSNEAYPSSDLPDRVSHRVIRWSLYLDYLLSGQNPPVLEAFDVTYGINAGGKEIDYDLIHLPSCDPLYTAEILLGEPRPFLGIYLGRDGPPGSDYYTVPDLLPLGNLLKFGYLHDGDPEDIRLVRDAIDRRSKTIDIDRIMDHGGIRLLRDWKSLKSRRP
jgi:hypothetical protein